jgi:hypothetical protein
MPAMLTATMSESTPITPITNVTPLARPAVLLRVEGLTLFVAALVAYSTLNGNWWLFAALLFVPDVFMLGYLRNPVWGAAGYNLGHTYLLPALLLGAGWMMGWHLAVLIAIIWFAHIGMDRAVGYGLKYSTQFKDTHLQRL